MTRLFANHATVASALFVGLFAGCAGSGQELDEGALGSAREVRAAPVLDSLVARPIRA